MPLFEVAITLPARSIGQTVEPEQLILTPTPVLAPDLEGAKTLAVCAASAATPETDPTTVARWKVYARPFV